MKSTKSKRKRAKETREPVEKWLKEEELKHIEERACKVAMKEVKLLDKQSKKLTRVMRSKCTGSVYDVKADYLTLEVTDGSPADAATESTYNNKGSSK